MNARTADFRNLRTGHGDTNQLRTSMTHSGFSVAVMPRGKYDQTFIAEVIFKLTGVLLIPAGGIVLLVPEIALGPALLPVQVGLLAAFIFIGVALHRRADRGFRRKIYVDSVRDEVRTGTLNIAGHFHLLETYPLKEIDSFFIVRSKDSVTPARLKMRLKTGARTISLLEGSEDTLVRILERTTIALRPPQKPSNRKFKTTKTGTFIRMTFG